MTSFPNIGRPIEIQQKKIKPVHRAQSGAGYTMSRPRGTVSKFEFSVSWHRLTRTERQILEAFFDANQGAAFNWVHPEGTVYGVIFADNDIEFKWKSPFYWQTTVTMKEI